MFKIRTILAFGAGAAAAYFLDPEHGERRRRFIAENLGGRTGAGRAAGAASAVGDIVERVVEGSRGAGRPRGSRIITASEAKVPPPA